MFQRIEQNKINKFYDLNKKYLENKYIRIIIILISFLYLDFVLYLFFLLVI